MISSSSRRISSLVISATRRSRSDAPAVQIYGGDHLGRSGVAIEPQRYPDAPNHDGFGPSVLRPGETYRTTTQWLVTQA